MELPQRARVDDVDEIRAKTDALAGGLAQARRGGLRAGDRQQAQPRRRGNGASTSDDEVVEEADYEVVDEEEAKTS